MEANKLALVTGANSGMGKETALALANRGMHVVMLCRNETRGEAALKEVQARISGPGSAELMLCDLGSLADIGRFVRLFRAQFSHLDVLVNNAGVITLRRQETKDGLELQFGVNHIGHFHLTNELLSLCRKGSRIVVVGSGAHKIGNIHFDRMEMKRGYTVFAAYGRAKLCNLLFTKELARRLSGTGVTINCVHPGAVATNMGVDRDTGFGKTIMRLLRPFFQTPEQGARTAIYVAASDACAHSNGFYYYKQKPAKTSKRAQDLALAAKLWNYSEDLIADFAVQDALETSSN